MSRAPVVVVKPVVVVLLLAAIVNFEPVVVMASLSFSSLSSLQHTVVVDVDVDVVLLLTCCY